MAARIKKNRKIGTNGKQQPGLDRGARCMKTASVAGMLLAAQTAAAGTCLNAAPPYDVPAQITTVTLDIDCSGIGGRVNIIGEIFMGNSRAIFDGTSQQDWEIVVAPGVSVANSSGLPTIEFQSPVGSVDNHGTIEQTGPGAVIYFNDGFGSSGPGHVTNRSLGVISSDNTYVTIYFEAGGTIVNEDDALIRNPTGIVVNVIDGAIDINNDGLIETLTGMAVASNGGGTLFNSGTINGMVNFFNNGTLHVTNTSTGMISGRDSDPAIRAYLIPAHITNAGSIAAGAGSLDAIVFSTDEDSLELQPGYAITGNVLASTGWDLLIFSGTGSDSFDFSNVGVGNQYQDFELLRLESGSWTFSGAMAEDFRLTGGFMDLGAGMVTVGDFDQYAGSVVNGTLVANSFVVEAGEILAALTGAGALEKMGSGTFALLGPNDYTGGTTIHEGTLRGNTVSLQGNIVNNDTLLFIQPGPGTYAGNVSGTGLLAKAGPGTVALTGTNGYTGGTLVGQGTLIGDTESLQGDIINNAALIFDQASAGIYTGAVSGSGTLTKDGASPLKLSGDSSSFQGITEVVEGTLVVDGALGNSSHELTASNGATLTGSGPIGGTVTIADATFAPGNSLGPGNSPGTFTIDGDLVLDSTSMLDFELAEPGGTNDRILADGDLILDGTLHVADLGNFGEGTYTLIEYTGALTDNTLQIRNLPAGFSASIDNHTPGEVNLVVAPAPNGVFSDRFEQ